MNKINIISKCCEEKAVVKNVYMLGQLVDAYYVCTKCNFPCDLFGYVVDNKDKNSTRRAP